MGLRLSGLSSGWFDSVGGRQDLCSKGRGVQLCCRVFLMLCSLQAHCRLWDRHYLTASSGYLLSLGLTTSAYILFNGEVGVADRELVSSSVVVPG